MRQLDKFPQKRDKWKSVKEIRETDKGGAAAAAAVGIYSTTGQAVRKSERARERDGHK